MNDNFDNFSWHDCKIYSLVFPSQDNCLQLDIDFIAEWIEGENSQGYNFLVAPAVLMFENVSDLIIKIETNNLAEFFIDEINRSNSRMSPNGKVLVFDFKIVLNVGEIIFTSTGFKQKITDVFQRGEEQTYKRDNG
jgi:hypothetical protein